MKGKALRRALQTSQAFRIDENVPLITDTTELITAEKAHEYLRKNKYNRPTNWRRVEEYSDLMAEGKWQLTPQGIVIDHEGDLINGQNRLWAVIYSGASVYMRVSRGTPAEAANVMDRGMPQSARDLATRVTGRKHSPIEASIARAILALNGTARPSKDALATAIEQHGEIVTETFEIIKGTKKTKAVIMILGAICAASSDTEMVRTLAKRTDRMATALENDLAPLTTNQCWSKGAAFVLAMEKARDIVQRELLAKKIEKGDRQDG